jgi:hypothetical protein
MLCAYAKQSAAFFNPVDADGNPARYSWIEGSTRGPDRYLLLAGDHAASLMQAIRLQAHALFLRERAQFFDVARGPRCVKQCGAEVPAVSDMHAKGARFHHVVVRRWSFGDDGEVADALAATPEVSGDGHFFEVGLNSFERFLRVLEHGRGSVSLFSSIRRSSGTASAERLSAARE